VYIQSAILHKEEFKPCFANDCDQIYRSKKEDYECWKCGQVFCVPCSEERKTFIKAHDWNRKCKKVPKKILHSCPDGKCGRPARYFCDLCNVSHCVRCSTHTKSAVREHVDDVPCKDIEVRDDNILSDTIRPCGHCKVPTFRVDGCGHITCIVCKKHWCWFCGEAMQDANATYHHMETTCKRDYAIPVTHLK
jgi:hypothetical protein